MKTYEYDAVIQASGVGKGGAYVAFPYDVRVEFEKDAFEPLWRYSPDPSENSWSIQEPLMGVANSRVGLIIAVITPVNNGSAIPS